MFSYHAVILCRFTVSISDKNKDFLNNTEDNDWVLNVEGIFYIKTLRRHFNIQLRITNYTQWQTNKHVSLAMQNYKQNLTKIGISCVDILLTCKHLLRSSWSPESDLEILGKKTWRLNHSIGQTLSNIKQLKVKCRIVLGISDI